MARTTQTKKSIFPFCAGLGCGMLLSLMLFFPITSRYLFSHIVKNPNSAFKDGFVHAVRNGEGKGLDLVRERKDSEYGKDIKDNRTIPLEVDPDPLPIESLDWDINTASQRIPAYLSQELKFKKKLFIGIVSFSPLTARISKLVPTTWGEAWGRLKPGDMTFYSTLGYDIPKTNGYNYQTLSGSSKLPDLPSPHMMYQILRDICSQYIDTHHFYYIGNSDTYISTSDLLNFTMQLNETDIMWIGHGTYRPLKQRYYTNDPDYFCHSGPGFILSRRTMQGLCPHLEVCEALYNRDYERPGYELSRCFRRFLNINCTKSNEARSLFYMSDFVPNPFFEARSFSTSITVNPIVDETALYVLHQYFIERQLNHTTRNNEYYHSIVQRMDRVLVKEGGMPDDRLVLGREGNANKYHHPDIVPWEKIQKVFKGKPGKSKDIILSTDHSEPSREVIGHDYIALSDVREITMKHVMENHFTDDDKESHIDTSSVYRKVIPGVGYQYMVDITKDTKKVASVCLNQPYGRVITYGTRTAPNVKITFILPMQDGSPKFQEFMQMFEQACMSADQPQNVGLLVVLYGSSKTNTTSDVKELDEKTSSALTLLNTYKQKYPKLSLRWINSGTSSFSHIKAVEMAVLALSSDTLVCSLHLDNQMSPEYLHHVRLNTVPHERLFFPVSFQLYKDINRDGDNIMFNKGFWRSFDYSTFCSYKQDIMQACGGDKFTSGEDLFQKSLTSGLDVFRAPEYALLTKWHDIDCSSQWLDTDERTACSIERKQVNIAVSASRDR
uniref:chondroitin sulfate synthase 1-like n=1 Tax=Styela clava TaxID=7725 RepID=UPI00193ABD9D|nr:chondroitin sulfate synthase 1-like [Styela clava]